MNTVLARMVERARGALSSAEPLIPSRFAAGGDGFAPGVLPSGDTDPAWRPNPGQLPAEAVVPAGTTAATEAMAPAGTTAAARRSASAETSAPHGNPVRHLSEDIQEIAQVVAEKPGAASTSVDAAASHVTPLSHVTPASPVRGTSPVSGTSLAPRPTDAHDVAATPDVGLVPTGDASRVAASSMAGISLPADPAAGSPEITITIGHIEVRAATPSQQGQQRDRPQFRPRVSLGDFLARGEDGRP
jgi:hypothetical protein